MWDHSDEVTDKPIKSPHRTFTGANTSTEILLCNLYNYAISGPLLISNIQEFGIVGKKYIFYMSLLTFQLDEHRSLETKELILYPFNQLFSPILDYATCYLGLTVNTTNIIDKEVKLWGTSTSGIRGTCSLIRTLKYINKYLNEIR